MYSIIECYDGSVRLANYETIEVNGALAIAGPLEVCVNRSWASICNNNSTEVDSGNLQVIELACSRMGYSGTGMST